MMISRGYSYFGLTLKESIFVVELCFQPSIWWYTVGYRCTPGFGVQHWCGVDLGVGCVTVCRHLGFLCCHMGGSTIVDNNHV